MSEGFEQTTAIRTATRRLLWSEKLGAALRGETTPEPATMPTRHEPIAEQTRVHLQTTSLG